MTGTGSCEVCLAWEAFSLVLTQESNNLQGVKGERLRGAADRCAALAILFHVTSPPFHASALKFHLSIYVSIKPHYGLQVIFLLQTKFKVQISRCFVEGICFAPIEG